jgi:putative phage-type endonuclease
MRVSESACGEEMNREFWLKWRRTGIGSTDSAPILEVDPMRTKLHVQAEKLDGLVTIEETELMEMGRDLEPVILKAYERKTGLKTRTQNKRRRSKKYPWMICTLDAEVPGVHPIEMKHIIFPKPGEWGQEEYTDEIPHRYIIQGQHNLAVLDADYIEFPVFLYGRLRIYGVKRNERLISRIVEATREFWKKHIKEKIPVDPDFNHPATVEFLKNAYAVTAGKSINLDVSIAPIAGLYKELGSKEYAAKKERNALKAQILHAMGDAETAFLPNGMILTRTESHREYEVNTDFVTLRIKTVKEKTYHASNSKRNSNVASTDKAEWSKCIQFASEGSANERINPEDGRTDKDGAPPLS